MNRRFFSLFLSLALLLTFSPIPARAAPSTAAEKAAFYPSGPAAPRPAVPFVVGEGSPLPPGNATAAPRPAVPFIVGEGSILVDFQTNEVYYEKNANVARPAASMTKLMSIYLVFEEIEKGNLTLDSTVTASAHASSISHNPAHAGLEKLKQGRQYQVDTLLKLIMTESCNGSMIALAEHVGGGREDVFVARMNAKAKEWGIEAQFADCCGLISAGNAVTPRAMAFIARKLITDYPQILDYSSLPSVVFQGETFESTNTLLRNGAVEGIDGLKTGTTHAAGYCFTGTAQREGRRIISVVMKSSGYVQRMEDSRQLLEYGFACRQEREAAWTAAGQTLDFTLAPVGEYLWPYAETGLTVAFTGIGESPVPLALTWDLNGEVLPGQNGDIRFVREGETVTFPCAAPAGVERLKAGLTATFPNGVTVRREVELPVAPTLTFSGRLGLEQATFWREMDLTVPCRAVCDQGLPLRAPAAWYYDGSPIPGYRNDAFSFGGDGKSFFVLHGSWLPPGEHTLEFRCNPDGLPGMEEERFLLKFTVLE